MDRIHRLGQHRPIKITRLIIENSIESRIVQLQEKKTALVESTVGKNSNALDKLSVEDLRFLFVMWKLAVPVSEINQLLSMLAL